MKAGLKRGNFGGQPQKAQEEPLDFVYVPIAPSVLIFRYSALIGRLGD
jgi:hypothetical protein